MRVERRVYKKVLLNKINSFDVKWLFGKARYYAELKLEKRLKRGISPYPLAVGLVVTRNCNCRCPMCNLPDQLRNLETATWRKVIDQLHSLGVPGIAISGGEPTLRKDAFELLRYAKDRNTAVTLNSNLLSVGKERVSELLDAAPDIVNVSIDSGRDEQNDKSRGVEGCLRRVLEHMRALADLRNSRGLKKPTVTAVTALSDLNLDDLDILFEKAKSAGADSICFIPLHVHDIAEHKTYVVKSDKVTADLYTRLVDLSARHGLPLENSRKYLSTFHAVMKGNPWPGRCNNGYTNMIVGSDLKIYRCVPYMNMRIPLFDWNPDEVSLKELWNHPKYRDDRLQALSCKQCFWDCHAELSYLIPM
jgi:MoaA/NifB/PqqE/SkfB family radical SAM enzyme